MLDAEHENDGDEPPIRGEGRAKQERVSDFERTVDWVGNPEALRTKVVFKNDPIEGNVENGKHATYHLDGSPDQRRNRGMQEPEQSTYGRRE